MTGSARHLAETAGYDTWQGVYKELWLTSTMTKLLSHNSIEDEKVTIDLQKCMHRSHHLSPQALSTCLSGCLSF